MWPFKPRKETPEEKKESGDRRESDLFKRLFLATWNFIVGIVCFFGRLVRRFLVTVGVMVLLIGGCYFFAEDIIRGIDNWKPQFFDAHIGSDRVAVSRLHDPGYFAEQTDFVSEDQRSVACISSPERRVLITDPAAIPPLFKDAIIASEDKRFYEHEGVDKEGVIRATIKRYFLHTSSSGASTLTMQMAKDLRHGAGRASTPKEKVGDIIMALRIEQEFSKGQLLEKYTNTPYLGRGAYGIEAASRVYFGRPAKDLKLHQVAFIVSLINKPGLPDRSFANDRSAKTREQVRAANWQEVKHGTRRVLELMSDEEKITADDYTRAADAIDNSLRAEVLPRGTNCGTNGYFAEYVRQDLIKRGFRVDKGGFTVPITRDDGIQDALEKAVNMTTNTYLARHVGDPDNGELRAGAVAIEFTGDVLGEVGNIDFRKFKYDVMAQGFRSPGSTFKPFVYAGLIERLVEEALAADHPPETLDDIVAEVTRKCVVLDAPIAVGMGRGRAPKWIQNFHSNSEPLYRGQISCSLAIAESRNAAAMRAGQQAGIKNVLSLLYDRLGMPRDPNHVCLPYPTTAIGACDMNPLRMSVAAALANGGFKVTPRFMNDVCKGGKSLLYKDDNGGQRDCDTKGDHREPLERVIHPAVAATTIEMLRGPLDQPTGTVHSLRTGIIPGLDPLSPETWKIKPADKKKRQLVFSIEEAGEIAGKTGTATNADGRTSDVWLLLFIPGPTAQPEKGIMLIFWMGKDSKDHPLGERGSTGGKGFAETGGRNWTHSAATVLAFLQKERGYLQPGFKFQPMMKDEVLLGFEAKRYTEPQQEVYPEPDGTPVDGSVVIDPSDPATPPELLKELPEEELSELPSSTASAPIDGEQPPAMLKD
ncbi:MAG: hypothetical protein A2845_01430 [Candidatus Lloydbacteria bacterium RIFCSPHIGHO2_01_FULL_49_22]|uniref:peptidoglycan glycosyltransferase n=1 Tax=Candidatus Lloydbacteria bacterium RIFCSPHIGHO2_01_FULL_49_22 TaxID=1798658 RepID=A0A1G2CZY5_9BACT|nr:MAG: hypothetical protein A2845_01430 [Candidatus Lloydbacteria bacterium RIFCSPHIGHO2_01_FULL_49_22]OGZ09960.1 MAG: hypothetical protein A3C14_04600 [Candidatus Lloydbacteria bacterium RIFCSPHIGHO2_02_FULL_50_18]